MNYETVKTTFILKDSRWQIKKAPTKKQTRRTVPNKSIVPAKPEVVAKKSAITEDHASKVETPVKEKSAEDITVQPPNYEINNLFNRQSIFTMVSFNHLHLSLSNFIFIIRNVNEI